MRLNACASVSLCRASGGLPLCRISPTSQRMPSPNKMPMKGGKCVICLKAGTATRTLRPSASVRFRSNRGTSEASVTPAASNALPRSPKVATTRGTRRLTTDATNLR